MVWTQHSMAGDITILGYGHVYSGEMMTILPHYCILKAEVHGRWSREKQRKRWINTISQ